MLTFSFFPSVVRLHSPAAAPAPSRPMFSFPSAAPLLMKSSASTDELSTAISIHLDVSRTRPEASASPSSHIDSRNPAAPSSSSVSPFGNGAPPYRRTGQEEGEKEGIGFGRFKEKEPSGGSG